MDAKEFELPIEGSLGKLALIHTQASEESKAHFSDGNVSKKDKKMKKSNTPISKKKK